MFIEATVPALDRREIVVGAMRESDAAIARAIRALGSGNGIAALTGMPAERTLELDGRAMSGDANMMMLAAAEVSHMPSLFDAFDRSWVSWSQVRCIVRAVQVVPVALRAAVDALIGLHAEELKDTEPAHLVWMVDQKIMDLRPDIARAEEKCVSDCEFFWVQPDLEGGCKTFGRFGPLNAATLVGALDAVAGRPQSDGDGDHTMCDHPIDEQTGDELCDRAIDPRTRSQQYAAAFVRMAEATLAGGNAREGLPPLPRVLAVLDLDKWTSEAKDGAMKLLWGLTGKKPRLTAIAAEQLLEEATVVPIQSYRGRMIAVGDETTRFSLKARRAIIARDQGCRAPGCTAPHSWCDAHHIVPGVGNTADDGYLHCRQDHRRAHDEDWLIRPLGSGVLEYTINGRKYISRPPP